MKIKRKANGTLTPVEICHGDEVEFGISGGTTIEIKLLNTGAEIMTTTLKKAGIEEPRAVTTYRFWGDFVIDGHETRLEREVGTQKSFYEPWVISGVRLWLDAVDAIFGFMRETHGPCRLRENCSQHSPPRQHARLVLQDASLRICPEQMHPWCPLPAGGLKIEQCYRGEDCWMGGYHGVSAHGGLDINHPRGTQLYAPIGFDDQFLYHSIETGYVNNRWRGIRRWPDGATWILESCHMLKLTVPEHQPLPRGQQYAEGAGVFVGDREHSHFGFAVFDKGDLIRLDPWILFWQMYQDQRSPEKAGI